MAYRNGTYVAFHAEGTTDPTASDMKYYQLIKAWTKRGDDDFAFINSHDKASSVRDTSKRATLRASLQERLRNSRNMVLIIGNTTRFDTDWVPFEIGQAVDVYKIPIIATYVVNYGTILYPKPPIYDPSKLSLYWPRSLADRIYNKTARVIHIPFRKEPVADAIDQFDHNNKPIDGFEFYPRSAYQSWPSFNLEY
jgi:hypothetical protein